MNSEQVILVDADEKLLGTKNKLQAHIDGDMHLAYSVMLYRYNEGVCEYLLQRRAMSKYHSGGLWSNTCCSHPVSEKTIAREAYERLDEELGIKRAFDLEKVAVFIYREQIDDLIEHEVDHVFVGHYEGFPAKTNVAEVMDCRWFSSNQIKLMMKEDSQQFTVWFSKVFDHVDGFLDKKRRMVN